MRRSPTVLLLAVLVVGAAGCGSSGGDAASTTVPKRTTTTSTAPVTSAPPLTGSTQPMPLEAQKRTIAFAPVLALEVCDVPVDRSTTTAAGDGGGVETTIPETTVPETTEPGPGGSLPTRSADGQLCYRLGPIAADGNDLTEAEAFDQEGDWVISVRARSTSVEKLNALFDACYAADETCPASAAGVAAVHGAVAIVVDGVVVSAPSVNGEGLADEGIQISGSFTEAEATRLADLLDA